MQLTDEQRSIANHVPGAFVEACPGSGKTRAVVARIARIAQLLPPRRGIAVLSFTNSAIEEFVSRCHALRLDGTLRHPGFIGTFDAFLRRFFFAPGGIEDVDFRPTVVDSWETLGVEVRLRGADAFPGNGVKLDLFDAATNQIDPGMIGHTGLRAHVEAHQTAYQQAATIRRRALRRKGYVSAADVRVHVVQHLELPGWSAALGQALAARFQEVIVDEAQDCNPLDCRIIRWLLDRGMAVTVVADPDQAIYGFRHGNPADIREIGSGFDTQSRLPLTGNFRSSPSICKFAATLRTRAASDVPLGKAAEITEPAHIIVYQGGSVPSDIGRQFCNLMDTSGIPRKNGIVLAHSRKSALRAIGAGTEDAAGNSNVARIARAVGTFWSPSPTYRSRESALRLVEWTILDLMGKIDSDELPSRAAEQRGIDPRWLRRSALELVSRIPRDCADTNLDRTAWIAALRGEVLRLRLTYREGTSERRYFPDRADADWHRLLSTGNVPEIRSATIHEAKGKEYDAVCVVIPPDTREPRRTEKLIACWEGRQEDEAKRVIYVGITRARKLIVIAIPNAIKDRLVTIIEASQTDYRIHRL